MTLSRLFCFFGSNPQKPSLLSQDKKSLDTLITNIEKHTKNTASWVYKYAIPIAGWVSYTSLATYWLSTEIGAKIHPTWRRHGEVAWSKGHTNYVNVSHYDCDNGGHTADRHDGNNFEFYCLAGPISTCCELTNGPNAMTAVGILGSMVGFLGAASVTGISQQYIYREGSVTLTHHEKTELQDSIKDVILDAFDSLPPEKQNIFEADVNLLKEKLKLFDNNVVPVSVLRDITIAIRLIRSTMIILEQPLSTYDIDEESDDEKLDDVTVQLLQ